MVLIFHFPWKRVCAIKHILNSQECKNSWKTKEEERKDQVEPTKGLEL